MSDHCPSAWHTTTSDPPCVRSSQYPTLHEYVAVFLKVVAVTSTDPLGSAASGLPQSTASKIWHYQLIHTVGNEFILTFTSGSFARKCAIFLTDSETLSSENESFVASMDCFASGISATLSNPSIFRSFKSRACFI